MTQYYCAIFHFAHGLQQVNMLSDTHAACVVTALAMFKKGIELLLDQRVERMKTTIGTKIS
jgi:hypothetical protein